MKRTLILSILMMGGLSLLLFAVVAFIQDKKYFTSAPIEVYKAVKPKKARFRGQHILGWILGILGLLSMVGPLLFAAADGVLNHFTFRQFFTRFSIMLLLLKLFDIIFFDWFLLCRSNFFPHFYPEVKDLLGPHLFGYNKKDHILHIILILVGSMAFAKLCTFL